MKTIAQLTYIPLSQEDPREKVQELLEHLAQYDVEIEVGYLSTTIIGAPKTVFEVIKDLYDIMSMETERFRFQVDLLSPSAE
ncbi:thiamine-binding protein [Gracilimonas halophila]|uniref:Thiamine-binding protein n=1 Tax=Gracilimonas halophila TaxID=1834464 RepID=A0ABW5JFX2_9BACT